MTKHSIGERVAQLQYGAGTITAIDEFRTTIDFDDHGVKTFVTAQVRLRHSNRTAPLRHRIVSRRRIPSM